MNFTRKPFNPTNRKPFLRLNRIDYDSRFGVNDDDDVENQNKKQIDLIPNAMLDNTHIHLGFSGFSSDSPSGTINWHKMA